MSQAINPPLLPWMVSLYLQGMCTVHPSSVSVKSETDLGKMFLHPPHKGLNFNKKMLPCWSPALYLPGKTRKNANVRSVSTIVFDYDAPTWSPNRIHQHVTQLGFAHVVHTTWSHAVNAPRYRLILFIDREIKPKEFSQVRKNALSLVGYKEGVDDLKDIARHYALPVRRTGSPYEGYLEVSLPVLKVDSLTTAPPPNPVLTKDTEIILDGLNGGERTTVAEVIELGEGKYKCACPFQKDSSSGSAFVRVCKDGRTFVCCTSARHDHEESKWWLKEGGEKKGRSRAMNHSVSQRKELLGDLPDEELSFVENHISYSAIQACFYLWTEGSWAVGAPMKKEGIVNLLIGRMKDGMDGRHVQAIIDHLLARPVFGLGCDSAGGRVVLDNGKCKLNLYQQPTLVPTPGKWDRVKEILKTLCDGKPEGMKWLIHWSASIIQRPERRSMVAVLALSPQQGIGKSLYGRILGEIIGTGNSVVVSNRALRDSFNASYVTRLLVLADEVGIDRTSKDVISELKAYIADDRVHCMAPYAARTEITNRMTWWLTSNNQRPLILERDDRRLTVFRAAKAPPSYKKMLQDCFEPQRGVFTDSFRAEVAAFANALHSVQVDYDLISRPYDSDARRELQDASRSSSEAFLGDLREVGPSAMVTTYPPSADYMRVPEAALHRALPCETLYGSYVCWCSRNGRRDVVPESIFRLAVQSIEGVKVSSLMRGGSRVRIYRGLRGKMPPADSDVNNLISLPRIDEK